jgi:PAS domain S-box-containing protein
VQKKPAKNKKRTSGVLPKLESEIQHILDALPFYVLLIDSDHKIIAANEAVKRDLQIDSQGLIGAYCPLVVHGSKEPVQECPLAEALENGRAVERELFDARNARWLNAAVYPTPIVASNGKPIYLHFVSDITELKNTAGELSRSLEHHRALGDLLQSLQYCQSSPQILEVLIDRVISLSWLGMAATAVGFLAGEKGLELIAHRNVAPALIKRCNRLNPGECLCGKVWESGRTIVCASDSRDHSIKYEGMDVHQHVVLPIKHKDHTLGVLTLYLNPGDEMDDFRLGFLEAAVAATGAALDGQLAREEVLRTRERFMAQVISSQEDERKRVAADLHDELCQSLSAILLEMQSLRGKDADANPIQQSLEARIRGLIDQVRQMAGHLRPTILDDYGLESALTQKIRELSAVTKMEIDFQCLSSTGRKERLPTAVEVGLYRVALEALDNAIIHSTASRVSVVLLQQGKVILLVEDDGCGFDYPAVRKDIDRCPGLIGMEERIALLGGTLRIESLPSKGTTVRAEVPVKRPNEMPNRLK